MPGLGAMGTGISKLLAIVGRVVESKTLVTLSYLIELRNSTSHEADEYGGI